MISNIIDSSNMLYYYNIAHTLQRGLSQVLVKLFFGGGGDMIISHCGPSRGPGGSPVLSLVNSTAVDSHGSCFFLFHTLHLFIVKSLWTKASAK